MFFPRLSVWLELSALLQLKLSNLLFYTHHIRGLLGGTSGARGVRWLLSQSFLCEVSDVNIWVTSVWITSSLLCGHDKEAIRTLAWCGWGWLVGRIRGLVTPFILIETWTSIHPAPCGSRQWSVDCNWRDQQLIPRQTGQTSLLSVAWKDWKDWSID